MSRQDKEAGWPEIKQFFTPVPLPAATPITLLDQVRSFLVNQGDSLSPAAKKNLLEFFETNLSQFEPLLKSGAGLHDIGSQILYAWEDRQYQQIAMYGSRQGNTMKFADPEDLRQNNHSVEDMYEQGREDAASGKAPLEEGDAAYMNGYNEHKTSSVDLQRAWRQFKNQNWYDGTVASVSDRMEVVEEWKRNVSRLIRNSVHDDQSLRIAGKIISEIDKEYEALSRTSMALGDFELDDYLDSMPALTVAKNYDVRVSSDGTADLGYNDGSWMFEAANAVNKEAANKDWDFFTTVHASEWTEDRPSDLLSSEPVFRDVAISYVEGKTAAILDVRKRAKIIDDFVTTAEKTRRQMRRNEASVRKAMTSTSKKKTASKKTSSRKVEANLDVGLTRTAFVVPYGVKDYNTDDSFGI